MLTQDGVPVPQVLQPYTWAVRTFALSQGTHGNDQGRKAQKQVKKIMVSLDEVVEAGLARVCETLT